jgi:anti-sigma-K factor RskA
MYDDDLDALAAEYVLGTLSAEERGRAEALLLIDPGFAEIVHQWERRLGELNVMVEAVEPPPEAWDKIKSEIGKLAPAETVNLAPSEPTPPAATPVPEAKTAADAEAGKKAEEEASPLLAALASTLLSPESGTLEKSAADLKAKFDIKPPGGFAPSVTPPSSPKIERGAEVIYLADRVWRWQLAAAGCGALAAALALVIALSQIAPGLFPSGIIHLPELFAQSPAPAQSQGSRLVAVLQQDPTSPAFLLTVDAASRMLTVRRVAAKADAGHSYQLWLISPRFPKPRSLGVVGNDEFTQSPIPANFDLDTVRSASYAVSYEPAGGSRSDVPSGPVLFSGKIVESLPALPPT